MKEIDLAELDQFEFEGVKYSLYDRYTVKDFCTKFLNGAFPRTSTYLLRVEGCPTRPISHRTMQLNLEKLFRSNREDAIVSVFERMSPLGIPEQVCGNCRRFYRHYTACDDSLGLTLLEEGHCAVSGLICSRKRSDRADNRDCFEWNAECHAALETLQKLRERRGMNDENHFEVLLSKKGRRRNDET